MNIKMERSFNAVGQGAFFDEQFYDERTYKTKFRMIYDCGILTKADKRSNCTSYIEREILKRFGKKSKNTVIDAVFLSQLDVYRERRSFGMHWILNTTIVYRMH